jgi:hypothetical protein
MSAGPSQRLAEFRCLVFEGDGLNEDWLGEWMIEVEKQVKTVRAVLEGDRAQGWLEHPPACAYEVKLDPFVWADDPADPAPVRYQITIMLGHRQIFPPGPRDGYQPPNTFAFGWQTTPEEAFAEARELIERDRKLRGRPAP